MNKIELRSISELVANKFTPLRDNRVEHYLIPNYQRGYRWKADEHVYDLLEDISAFANKSRNSDEIYCLQPVVVCRVGDEWEIIDGQQRLTTISLILRYLKEECYEISYSYRPESSEVLINPMHFRDDMPDHYFICTAYLYIKEWFDAKNRDLHRYSKTFANILFDNVKVIWYEIELQGKTPIEQEKNKIEIFNRLNIGKIPLDDAELIRALFIQNISFSTERNNVIQQAVFSNEWNEIEQYLQIDDVWGFIHNNQNSNYPNRILKLFELVAKTKSSEGRATYKWFENYLKNNGGVGEELWDKIKTCYSAIRHWFNDLELYHLIGALSKEAVSLEEIFEAKEKCTKTKFIEWIKDKIKAKYPINELEKLNYDADSLKIKQLLLLFNILSAIETKNNQNIRFKFHCYDKAKWSIEHINAQHSDDPMKDEKNIRGWIQETLYEMEAIGKLEDISILDDDINRLRAWTEIKYTLNVKEFENVRRRIEKYFDDEVGDEMHSMENLSLLSSKDNAVLNKAIFPVKRKRLLELEKQGRFIPQCTKNVFLKAYSKEYSAPYKWTKSDREYYIKEMRRVFNSFNKTKV